MQRQLEVNQHECAHEVLDVVPIVMHAIRREMRRHGAEVVSMPQFRALSFVSRHKGSSLSEVADHIGLTLPSMSTLIDGLVTRKYMTRKTGQDDRRRMTLMLTDRGEATLRMAREGAQAYLTHRLGRLSERERGTVLMAMRILRQNFAESS